MTGLRYPISSLRGDYARAGVGLTLALIPGLAIPASSPSLYVLGGAAILFLAFGLRTWRRQRSYVVLDDHGISIFKPSRVSLAWTDIRSVKLSYFSTRSDRAGGWMQLTLKGIDRQRGAAPRSVRIDSALDGFDDVVRAAAAAVRCNQVAVTPATRINFGAFGIDLRDSLATSAASTRASRAAAREIE